MTTRTRTIILLAVLAAALVVGCLDDGDRIDWFDQVNSRQRGLERPTLTPPASARMSVHQRTERGK